MLSGLLLIASVPGLKMLIAYQSRKLSTKCVFGTSSFFHILTIDVYVRSIVSAAHYVAKGGGVSMQP